MSNRKRRTQRALIVAKMNDKHVKDRENIVCFLHENRTALSRACTSLLDITLRSIIIGLNAFTVFAEPGFHPTPLDPSPVATLAEEFRPYVQREFGTTQGQRGSFCMTSRTMRWIHENDACCPHCVQSIRDSGARAKFPGDHGRTYVPLGPRWLL